jgi:uncharacterized protein YndB with AHSA1/START domain
METITVERTIAAPIEDVFDFISTASNYTRSRLVLRERLARPGDGAPYGVGAVRVLLWVVGWFHEVITGYDRPYRFDYRVDRSFPPSEHKEGHVSFTEVAGGTHVLWTTTVELRFPLLGGLLTRLVARPILAHVFNAVLDAAQEDLERTPAH